MTIYASGLLAGYFLFSIARQLWSISVAATAVKVGLTGLTGPRLLSLAGSRNVLLSLSL